MFSLIMLLAAASLVASQTNPPSTLPWGLDGKVDKIVGIASMACSNKYINNTDDAFTIDDIVCDKDRVPQQFQQYIPGLKLGPDSAFCGGYACALRFLGCVDATYRVEAKIISAIGVSESCSERAGLNASTCASIGKFITNVPLTGRKRDEPALAPGHMEPFTEQELAAEVAVVKRAAPAATPSEADVHMARLLIRSLYPVESQDGKLLGLAADETFENYVEARKRQEGGTFQEILKQVQLCNDLINAGVNLAVAQIPALAVVKDKFGVCGAWCEMAMCGLNLMCHTVARSALLNLEAQRVGKCNKTSCSKWVPKNDPCTSAPACDASKKQYAPQTLNFEQCPPPKVIRSASQATAQDCCDTCDDVCAIVPCNNAPTSPAQCGVPVWPLCKPFKVEKANPFHCCSSCVNVCKSDNPAYAAQQPSACGPQPTSCEAGKILGPASPSSCCLACVDPCANVQCPDLVTADICKSRGQVLSIKTPAQAAASQSCVDCCPACVTPGPGAAIVETKTVAASTVVVAAMSVIVAVAAMM